MLGFRNVAVHDDTDLNYAVAKTIITERLGDFSKFSKTVLTLT